MGLLSASCSTRRRRDNLYLQSTEAGFRSLVYRCTFNKKTHNGKEVPLDLIHLIVDFKEELEFSKEILPGLHRGTD